MMMMMMMMMIIMMSDFIERESMNIRNALDMSRRVYLKKVTHPHILIINTTTPYHISQSYNYDDDEWTFWRERERERERCDYLHWSLINSSHKTANPWDRILLHDMCVNYMYVSRIFFCFSLSLSLSSLISLSDDLMMINYSSRTNSLVAWMIYILSFSCYTEWTLFIYVNK